MTSINNIILQSAIPIIWSACDSFLIGYITILVTQYLQIPHSTDDRSNLGNPRQ